MLTVGHSKQLEDLERSSAAVLLRGPSGIGKWRVAHTYAASQGGVMITLRDGPTVEQGRELGQLFTQRPVGGSSAVALVDLDRCSHAVQNTMLKTIEEMPDWGKVILVASKPPLPTVVSRCEIIEFASLTQREVSDVLIQLNVSPAEAEVLSTMAAGSVERALQYREAAKTKPLVLQYVDALIRVDRVALAAMLERWTPDTTAMLWRWINEVLQDNPKAYTKAELGIVHKLSVGNFYQLVDCMRAGDSPDLAAMKVWKR